MSHNAVYYTYHLKAFKLIQWNDHDSYIYTLYLQLVQVRLRCYSSPTAHTLPVDSTALKLSQKGAAVNAVLFEFLSLFTSFYVLVFKILKHLYTLAKLRTRNCTILFTEKRSFRVQRSSY